MKKINRVADDLQKRVYEIAEVSLDLKFLYGTLKLEGLNLPRLIGQAEREEAGQALRRRISGSGPVIVALILCRVEEFERSS